MRELSRDEFAELPCYWVVRTRPDGGDPDEDIR
jgi:hypothetical protein